MKSDFAQIDNFALLNLLNPSTVRGFCVRVDPGIGNAKCLCAKNSVREQPKNISVNLRPKKNIRPRQRRRLERFSNERSMSKHRIRYCIGDIKYMPTLFRTHGKALMGKDYSNGHGMPRNEERWATAFAIEIPADFFGDPPGEWAQKVVEESRKRVMRSWGEGWDRNGPWQRMTVSPWSWSDLFTE